MALKEQWVGSTEHPSESVRRRLAGTGKLYKGTAGLPIVVLLLLRLQSSLETQQHASLAALRCPHGCPGAIASLREHSMSLDITAELEQSYLLCSSPRAGTVLLQ